MSNRKWRSEGVKEWRSEGVKEWRSEGVKEWRSEGVKEWRSEGVRSREMFHFVMPYIKQNKKLKQTIESAQYGLEIIFNTTFMDCSALSKCAWNLCLASCIFSGVSFSGSKEQEFYLIVNPTMIFRQFLILLILLFKNRDNGWIWMYIAINA